MTTANIKITKVLLGRGNTAVSANYTGVMGEVTMDTTLKTLRVHDGVAVGGTRLATYAELANVSVGNINLSGYATTAQITAANANAAAQAVSINAISANLGSFQTYANTTFGVGTYSNTNVAAYLGAQSITSANIGGSQTYANVTFSTVANAASQQIQIDLTNANVIAANDAISALQANAAVQASLIDTLTGNAATQGGVLNDLVSNAAAQADNLNTLLSNAAAQSVSLSDLVANAAVQAEAIASITGTYSNANVQAYLTVFDGNILPAANVTYSLGSEQFQWRDLWVSNNTIYIGNTPIRVDGGTLLVNGAPVSGTVSDQDSELSTLGSPTFATITVDSAGTVQTYNPAPELDTYFTLQGANDRGIALQSTDSEGSTKSWLFNIDGNLTVPGNIITNEIATTIGTANASVYLDSTNRVAKIRAKKHFNRSFGQDGVTLTYTSATVTAAFAANEGLYFKQLLFRLTDYFNDGSTDFVFDYSNVTLTINPEGENLESAVTNVVDDANDPPTYTITLATAHEEPIIINDIVFDYDYNNTMGLDVDNDRFGIATDNDDLELISGRDIDLIAADDLRLQAGSFMTIELVKNDNQGNTDGIEITTTSAAGYNTWLFQFDGNLTIPGNINYANGASILSGLGGDTGDIIFNATTISAPNDESITLQVKDENANVCSSLLLNPNYGRTVLRSFTNEQTNSYSNTDWATAVWTGNELQINDAAAIVAFADQDGVYGRALVSLKSFSINGGTRISFSGVNIGGNNITFYTGSTFADPDPTTVTTVEFFYRYRSEISMDYDGPEMLLEARDMDIHIDSDDDIDIQAGNNVDIIGDNLVQLNSGDNYIWVEPNEVNIEVSDGEGGFSTWTYEYDNDTPVLKLPAGGDILDSNGASVLGGAVTGNISVDTSSVQFVANSSGDGYGYSTIRIIPDTSLEGTDQYLIIDPTIVGHIHIRAGGTQDNSSADLFLGGENSHVMVTAGSNPPVYIRANSANWVFGTDSSLSMPTGGNLYFDNGATSVIDGVTNINAVGTIGANVIQVLSDLTGFGASPAPVIYGFSSISTTSSAVNEGNISASGNLVASQNAYVTGNVFAARYNYANGVSISTSIQNGTSNVGILSSGGLVSVNVGGVANIALFTTTGASIGGTLSVSGFTATGAVTLATASGNINLGISQTTGHVTVGGTAQTGTILIGQSTYPQTINIGHGVTGSGNTKIIQIGENGAAGSTTLIDIGPATASAAGTVTFNTATVVNIANTGGSALSVAGNITGGNVSSENGFFWSNGAAYSTGSGTYGNTEVGAYLLTGINSNLGTLSTTNFSTANARITGGSITGITGTATTLQVSNFSSGNVFITGAGGIGYSQVNAVSRIGNVYSTYANFTNFSTANAVITGGSITGVTGAATTWTATNLSSTNVAITGGYLEGLANVTATGNVTAGNLIGYGSNTSIIAGVHTSTFDNQGMVTVPNLTVSGSIDATSITTDDLTINDTGWTNFTPTWYAGTVPNSIGNGLAEGRYRQLGKTVEIWMQISMGSTTTFGNGEYKVSLPVDSRMLGSAVLSLVMRDEGTRFYNSLAHNGYSGSGSWTSSNVTLFWDTGVVTNTAPFTWAADDWFIVSGTYEAT